MEMEKRIVQHRVDAETGEIVGVIYEGDRIVHKEQIDFVKEYVQKFDKEHEFVKIYKETLRCLDLTPSEKLMMYELMDYVSYQDNYLRSNGILLDIKAIARLLHKEYEATRQVIKRLVDKGVLAVVRTGCFSTADKHTFKAYIFNPYIGSCSSMMSSTVLEIFKCAGWGFGNIGHAIQSEEVLK